MTALEVLAATLAVEIVLGARLLWVSVRQISVRRGPIAPRR